MFGRAILLPADSQRGISCVAFRNLRPRSFCRPRRQIPKTRVARLDDVSFATPPSPKSGKLCPIVTQFRAHSGYFDLDPQRDAETIRIPRVGHAEESFLSRDKGSRQSLGLPYVPPTNYLFFQQHSRFRELSTFVFIHIPASVSSFPQRSFVFIDIPALVDHFLKLLRLHGTGRQ
jgi:hypothetical protein